MKHVFKTITIPSIKQRCTGSVIVLHGSGDSGPAFHSWWSSEMNHYIQFDHLRLLLPTAAPMYYTPAQCTMNVWFDRVSTNINVPENASSTDAAVESLSQLIDKEVASGIPLNRIVIGGFSMGGTASLHVAYRSRPRIAGVFAMSSFLNNESAVYSELSRLSEASRGRLPPLFQSHGDMDNLVLHDWGQRTHARLKEMGVVGEFHTVRDGDHQLHVDALQRLHAWLDHVLPKPDDWYSNENDAQPH